MRRNLLLAVAAGTLLLGACSDQTPTEPTVPPPSETFGSRCNVPRFPLLAIANQIKAIYPATPRAQALLRAEALLRAGAIKLAWDTCHPVIARKVAFAFIDWLNRHTPPNKQTQVHDLIVAILRAVGAVPATGGDFGVGFFDPDSDENTVITTENHRALIELVPGSFLVPTVIVISRVPGDPPLTGFDGNQYPPTYDYNAINSTNTHVLQPGKTANIAFCLVVIGPPTMEGNGYPDPANLAIGHNPFGGGFEILEPFDLEGTELRNSLTCPGIDDVIGSAGSGLQNFANAALQTAGRFLMPQPLWAAALGKEPPPPPRTGQAGSLSPFKPVEVEGVSSNQIEPYIHDLGPEDQNSVGEPLDACNGDSCEPEFRVTDGEVPVQTSTSLTVSLIKPTGSTATLGGTTVKSTSTDAPYTAVFDGLTISEPGTYQLLVTSSSAASHPTGVFTVSPAADDPLVLNVTTVEKLPGGTQHFVVQDGSPGPYIWSVNGVDGGNATFGIITSSGDYTAPAGVPDPAMFDVCARRQANPTNTACVAVTISPVPSSGQDVVVFNDVDFFSAGASSNANNQTMYQNLIGYTADGQRATQNGILIHFGQESRLWNLLQDPGPAYVQGFIDFLTEDYDVTVVDDPDALLGVIPSTIKVAILVLPTVAYTDGQINILKLFASEGGRIVFIGEHNEYYGDAIATVENPFFQAMGAELTNVGALIDCGLVTLPQSSIKAHQITTGMTNVTMGCASTMTLGDNDYGLITGSDGESFIAGVAKIDVTPLSLLAVAHLQTVKSLRITKPAGIRARDPLGKP